MDGGRLVLASPSLAFGGMELQLLELARAAGRRGRQVTILAGDGPLREAARAVAEVELVDWSRPRAETARRALELAGPEPVSVFQADPSLLHLIAPLAAAGAVHLCLHNRPGSFERWFNPGALARFERLVPALYASGRVTFTASNTAFARAHAQRLGLPAAAVRPWFPGVDAPRDRDSLSTGPVRRVSLVCRLSPEKLTIVAAAAELVAAGLAEGADMRLDLHGAGPAEQEARALLAARLPERAYRLHGPTARPLDAIAGADAVVNAGRAAIEALVTGRRVVTACMLPGTAGGLGQPVLPDTFGALMEDNFVWRDEPQDALATLRCLEAMSAEEVRTVRDAARRELSAEAVLEGHLAAIDPIDRTRPPGPALLDGLVELCLELEDAHAAAKQHADELWAARPPAVD